MMTSLMTPITLPQDSSALTLYHYWRSSCSWRVRWALELKEMPVSLVAINLLKNEQKSESHLKRHPLGQVPVLEWADPSGKAIAISDSIAILRFLDRMTENQNRSNPWMAFPADPWLEAKVNELVGIIASGTQPIQNLSVMKSHSEDPLQQKQWASHFIQRGLRAFETLIADTSGTYCVGDSLTAADLCLIPQCYNARRFEVALEDFPVIRRIHDRCEKLETYQRSCPEAYAPDS
jgi:maleylacetoacetate isomerase